jgi:magnesium-transporting ATPase (P-type)
MIFQNKLKQATPIGIAKLRFAKIPSIMITGKLKLLFYFQVITL